MVDLPRNLLLFFSVPWDEDAGCRGVRTAGLRGSRLFSPTTREFLARLRGAAASEPFSLVTPGSGPRRRFWFHFLLPVGESAPESRVPTLRMRGCICCRACLVVYGFWLIQHVTSGLGPREVTGIFFLVKDDDEQCLA